MRFSFNILLAAGLLLTLSHCAPTDDYSDNNLLISFARPDPVPSGFFTCYGYGCKYRARIELTHDEWLEVRAKFDPPAEDAATERQQIGEAVAQLERFFGQRTGTLVHQEDSRLNWGDPTQLDCVDNSVNTWTYLTMLARDGLLLHHKVAGLAHRGTLLTLDFSNTAVIVQTDNGEAFVVDPWLGDAGKPPPIFTLELWFRSG